MTIRPRFQVRSNGRDVRFNNNSEWEDILGTGRLHIKRISDGSGEQVNRTSSIKIEISVPSVPFDIKFGTNECELKVHSTLEVRKRADSSDLDPFKTIKFYSLDFLL